MVGVYVGTREDNLAECMRIIADQLTRIGDGDLGAGELERAKENLKGRIMLSMESTSNRASRLGKSVLTDTELLSLDRICAEIDAVEPEPVAALARQLFAPGASCRWPASGPDEDGSARPSVSSTRPCSPADRTRPVADHRAMIRVILSGATGKVGRALAAGDRDATPDSSWRRRPPRRWATLADALAGQAATWWSTSPSPSSPAEACRAVPRRAAAAGAGHLRARRRASWRSSAREAAAARACSCSTPPTSRSARC